MTDEKLTLSQRQAVTVRDRGILVSAGAGSGKSHVLVERLKSRILDDGRDIDSFIIITYTKAAAAELKGKISDALADELEKNPASSVLRRQAALLGKARISTIHSCCASLLRENCSLLNGKLSPDFKIADEERMSEMKAQVLNRVLDACYNKLDLVPDFELLVDMLNNGRDDSGLMDLVLDLHTKMQTHPRPAQWAEKQEELLKAESEDPGETPWGIAELENVASIAGYWTAVYDECLEMISTDELISTKYGPVFSDERNALALLARKAAEGDWRGTAAGIPVFGKLSPVKKDYNPEISGYVKKRRDACKAAIKKITLFNIPDDILMKDLRSSCRAMTALLKLTLLFDGEFIKEKRGFNLVDYSDLEHLAAELLTENDGSPTELARDLSRKYTEILVDEYQDVSRVQETIFHALSDGGKKLFAVGDVKQSIYRFRLADPAIFTEKYKKFPVYEDGSSEEHVKILLRENFRSRAEILDCANAVFSAEMSAQLGDIEYDNGASLVLGNTGYTVDGRDRTPELMLLELPKTEKGDEVPDKVALEAAFIAEKIRGLVESRSLIIQDGKEQRPALYGDIAVLVSRANAVSSVYRREFSARGVPLAVDTGSAFYDSPEISTVISFLDIISNPHKDIPLLAVLRSPLFGFTADDLAGIRACCFGTDFYTALCRAAQNEDVEARAKCLDFTGKLDALRALAADMPLSDLLWTLYNTCDALAVYGAMEDGAQRRANLISFTDTAESFESTGYKGLYRFVKWLQRVRKSDKSPGKAVHGGAVTYMTIHKSKGLQFPVVFLCDTAHGFNDNDSRQTVQVHAELGLGARLTDRSRGISYPTLAHRAIINRSKREDRSEQMRLLYVALTRAEEYMFISGACPDISKLKEKVEPALSVPMEPEALLGWNNPLLWLLAAAELSGGKLKKGEYRLEAPESLPAAPAAEPGEIIPAEAVSAESALLQESLSFTYPHKAAEALPSKLTATGIKGLREADFECGELDVPDRQTEFRSDFSLPAAAGTGSSPDISPIMRGNATHLVLQYGCLENMRDTAGTEAEIRKLAEAGILTPDMQEAVNREAICRLLNSGTGKRLLSAVSVRREFRFSVLRDASEFYGESCEGEQILLQGAVDCLFEEDDGTITILDYKTDRVFSDAAVAERAEMYKPQLEAYHSAVSGIFRKPVKQCIICFLESSRECVII